MKRFSVTLFPGYEGDCLWIEYGEAGAYQNVLIDGGRKKTFEHLKVKFSSLPEDQRQIELLVVTHIDRDHIEGILELLSDNDCPNIAEIWFNGYQHLAIDNSEEIFGPKHGEKLSEQLNKLKIPWNRAFQGKAVACSESGPLPVVELPGGLKLTILSPTTRTLRNLIPEWEIVCRKAGIIPGFSSEAASPREEIYGPLDILALTQEEFRPDHAVANGSSIAFIAEYGEKRVLFAADAHSDVLESSIERIAVHGQPLALNAVKVSHHGSAHSTSPTLLKRIQCDTWIFSTNGAYFQHPARTTIARILRHSTPRLLAFNYQTPYTSLWDAQALKEHWRYTTMYPAFTSPGMLTVDLI